MATTVYPAPGWCESPWCAEAWPGFIQQVHESIPHQWLSEVSTENVLPHSVTLSFHQEDMTPNQFSVVDIPAESPITHQAYVLQSLTEENAHQYHRPLSVLGHQWAVEPTKTLIPLQARVELKNDVPSGYSGAPWAQEPWPFVSANVRVYEAITHQWDSPSYRVLGHQWRINVPNDQDIAHQFEQVVNSTRKVAYQWLQIPDGQRAISEQFVTSVADDASTMHQWLTSIARQRKTFHQWMQQCEGANEVFSQATLRIATRETLPHSVTIAPIGKPAVTHQWLQSVDTNPSGTDRVLPHSVTLAIAREAPLAHQVQIDINRTVRTRHQFNIEVSTTQLFPFQFNYLSPYVFYSGGWLTAPWPGDGYGWPYASATGTLVGKSTYNQWGMQISTNVAGTNSVTPHQFSVGIAKQQGIKHQYEPALGETMDLAHQFTYVYEPDVFQNIEKLNHQYAIQSVRVLNHQWRLTVYNNTNFRILWEFASDGLEYNNVMASSQAGTDFAATNLKDDLIEHVWRANGCQEEWFQVDVGTGQTALFDTIALISHNLSAGARVTVYGLGSAYSSTPTEADWANALPYAEIAMPNGGSREEPNLIWLAPQQPTESFRFWRVKIVDPYNEHGYVEVGRFVAGQSLIFSKENFGMNVEYGYINFKDSLDLNGYSSIANNRALRKRLKLTFPDLNAIGDTNYARLKSYMTYCRDTLKALVIADPANPYRFTVFAKLSDLPTHQLSYVDASALYATMTLDWNEGK